MAAANTARFIAALPESTRAWGILAVNPWSFQGGHPLQGKTWIAEADGARPSQRLIHNSGPAPTVPRSRSRPAHHVVIEACDRLGMVVILQCFYFGQDTVFRDEDAHPPGRGRGGGSRVRCGYTNVIIEIANEVMLGHYHHEISPARVAELIERARRGAIRTARRAPVSTPRGPEQPQAVDRRGDRSRLFRLGLCVHPRRRRHRPRRGGTLTLVARKIATSGARPWHRGARGRSSGTSSTCVTVEAAVSRQGVCRPPLTPYLQTMGRPRGVWETRHSGSSVVQRVDWRRRYRSYHREG